MKPQYHLITKMMWYVVIEFWRQVYHIGSSMSASCVMLAIVVIVILQNNWNILKPVSGILHQIVIVTIQWNTNYNIFFAKDYFIMLIIMLVYHLWKYLLCTKSCQHNSPTPNYYTAACSILLYTFSLWS